MARSLNILCLIRGKTLLRANKGFFICSILRSTFFIYLYALIPKMYLKHLRVSLPTVCSRQARQTFKSKEQKSQILLNPFKISWIALSVSRQHRVNAEHDGSGGFSFYCRIKWCNLSLCWTTIHSLIVRMADRLSTPASFRTASPNHRGVKTTNGYNMQRFIKCKRAI